MFGRLPDRTAAVLAAVGRLARPTVRGVAAEVGCSVSTAHAELVRLRRDGWVTWEDGRDATLRANYKVVAHTPYKKNRMP